MRIVLMTATETGMARKNFGASTFIYSTVASSPARLRDMGATRVRM